MTKVMATVLVGFCISVLGCSSDEAVICEKLDECNLLADGISVEECEEEAEKEATESELEDCASCLDEKSCGSIGNGACAADCGG